MNFLGADTLRYTQFEEKKGFGEIQWIGQDCSWDSEDDLKLRFQGDGVWRFHPHNDS
jgi:hypothetical protein